MLERRLPNVCSTRCARLWPRASSSLATARPSFTSFFFNNDNWPSPPAPTSTPTSHPAPIPHPPPLPQTHSRPLPPLSLPLTLKLYAHLSKSRLTSLIVLTSMSGVALSPLPTALPVLLSTALGTALCSASANALNQIQEAPYDAQMVRTRGRPLVRRVVSPVHAVAFAVATGVAGPVVLWAMVNPTTALLGAANIALYAGLYTWSKRKHVVNTWIGAVVGAIPPLMGWTACGGHLLPSPSSPPSYFLPSFLSSSPPPLDLTLIDNPLSALALFTLLFSWQFPHFNSLSHLTRGSYAQAGYKMLSVASPSKNKLVALRHALLLIPICSVLTPLSGLTTWYFALTSLVPNGILAQAAWRFWRTGGEREARALWYHSLWYLPVVMGLMMVHKRGMSWLEWAGLKEKAGEKENVAEQRVV